MPISIAERLRPFSHLPGTLTILPGWGCLVQVFPCLIRLYHLQERSSTLLAEIPLVLKGPVEEFTITNDFEKGRLTISGKTADGWVRYHLVSGKQDHSVRLILDRAPENGFVIEKAGKSCRLQPQEYLDLLGNQDPFEAYMIPQASRLSLGNHKAQDWDLIRRRGSLTEMLPLIHRLGQLVPSLLPISSKEGSLALLEACEQSFHTERPERGEEAWQCFLLGGFREFLVPQIEDHFYQGLWMPTLLSELGGEKISPLVILTEASRLISQLFVKQEQNSLSILPYLLPSLHQGRFVDIPVEGGRLSLEWTKKAIRQMIFCAHQDSEWNFNFRSEVKSFRLRQHVKEKGERINCGTMLFLKKDGCYLFDNFQK